MVWHGHLARVDSSTGKMPVPQRIIITHAMQAWPCHPITFRLDYARQNRTIIFFRPISPSRGDYIVAKFAVILPAAGRSSRFKDKNYKKPFMPMANKAVWLYSAERFLSRDDVVQTILVISPEDREDFNSKFGANIAILGIDVVEAGRNGPIRSRPPWPGSNPTADFVCIHDAARPCICDEWIDQIFSAAEAERRGHFRHSRRRHAETGGGQSRDRRDRRREAGFGKRKRRRSSAAS